MALIIVAALGQDLWILVITIAIIQAPRVARVARGLALGISSLEYVEVARARGEPLLSILFREIFPNTKRGLAVEFALRMTFSILLLSSLSFLGLGIQPPYTDWGGMLRENITAMTHGNYTPILAPAIAIGSMTVGVSLLVDWLGSKSGRAIPEEIRK